MDIAQLMEEDGLSVKAFYPNLPRSVGMVSIDVGIVRSHGLKVLHEPVLIDWYHSSIRDDAKALKKVYRKLLASSKVIIPINAEAAAKFHDVRLPNQLEP